jgi:hypothetical protein
MNLLSCNCLLTLIHKHLQMLRFLLLKVTYFILIIKANEMHCSQIYFDKELCMFQTDLLSIIRSCNTVCTTIGICHASYVDCLLARSGWSPILTSK